MDLEKKRSIHSLQFASLPEVATDAKGIAKQLYVIQHDGSREVFDINRIYKTIAWASEGHQEDINADEIMQETVRNIYDGITVSELSEALILATIAFIEQDPAYGYMAAQLLLKKLFIEVTGVSNELEGSEQRYRASFIANIERGVQYGMYDKRLLTFDLERLAQSLQLECDQLFYYMGLKTLYERYFVKCQGKRMELPQVFWMRVAMGLAINEENKTEAALSFYRLMSRLLYVPSTPTLLHAGLKRPHLSS